MSWNGSGTYTRGYPSWAADAASNLPISSTKFDTEDNDFASGIQNCLTIDGQNKPNATLTWAQALALTKGADATIFSIARTGGSNNPSLTWSVADAANSVTATLVTGGAALTLTPALYTVGNSTDNAKVTFAGTGIITAGGGATNSTDTFNLAAANNPSWSLTNTIAAANAKVWDCYADSSGVLHYRIVNDANNSALDWLTVTRTGLAVTTTAFTNGIVEISDQAGSPTLFPVGYLGLPQNNQLNSYGFVLADRAKQVLHNSGAPHTFTVPANASVAFANGDVLHIVNPPGAGVLTIAITTDLMTFVPAGSTGSRTLTAPGTATIEKYGPTSWIIYGSNLT